MKYLFVNTFATRGSTGRIVCEIARQLKMEGHECVIAYGRDSIVPQDIKTIKIGTKFDIAWHGLMTRLFDVHGFCSKRATRDFLAKIEEYNPDVIWLHNIHGYYLNIEMLFKYIKRKGITVKWTLHDCWSLTGHCPYFSFVECDKWKKECKDCPQLERYPSCLLYSNTSRNYQRKKTAFLGVKDMELFVPSKWLEKLVKESYLGSYQVTVRYNTVENCIFKPTPSDIRRKYGIDDNEILVLSVANDWTKYKGLDDLCYMAEKLPLGYRVVLVGLSKRQKKKINKSVIGIERTQNLEELVKLYSAADVLVSASKEETFGMTILEARKCGTQVIAYKDTACEEVVNMYGGILVEKGIENIYSEILNMEKSE